jgi:hypothetical protein
LSKRYTSRGLLKVKADIQLVDPHVLPLAACVAELGQRTALEAAEPLAGAGLTSHAAQTGEEALLIPLPAVGRPSGIRSPLGLVVVAQTQTASALPKSNLVFEDKDFLVVFPLVEGLGV